MTITPGGLTKSSLPTYIHLATVKLNATWTPPQPAGCSGIHVNPRHVFMLARVGDLAVDYTRAPG